TYTIFSTYSRARRNFRSSAWADETRRPAATRASNWKIIMRTMSIASPRTQNLLSIQDFTSELRKLPVSSFEHVDAVQRFLCEHPVNPESLSPYLLWDRQHYTRNLIDKNSLYELVAICWEIGQASSIHNHRDQNCWMAAPIGALRVQNYRVLA